MKKPKPIKFTHIEAAPAISAAQIVEIEELFADLLFEAWLKERGASK